MKHLSQMMAKKAQIKEIRSKNLQKAVREKSSIHDPTAGRITSTNSRSVLFAEFNFFLFGQTVREK